ncbi:MAG TPA: M24 family metallopeptidase [Acidimicrobiia bacterium]|jgi:Xaa-Pro aminopeptidase
MTTTEHRERVVAAMRDQGIDVLLLGREANARYVSGADRLWLAGTRPFAPGCVVVGSTGSVHVLAITDDGLPADLTADRLYPISWNPLAMLGRIAAIEGVGGARRIGTDGMTALFEQLIAATLGPAELVDAEAVLRTERRHKSADDIRAITAAVSAAEDALCATADALAPGVTELELQAVYEEAMTTAGLTAPAFEGSFSVADAGTPSRVFSTDRRVTDGDLVHVRAGVMRDGWEGLVARTLRCGDGVVRSSRLDAAVRGCAPGATVASVRGRAASIEGTGMGHEELAPDDLLEPGMVLAVEVLADGILDGAVVHLTADGPELLSTS